MTVPTRSSTAERLLRKPRLRRGRRVAEREREAGAQAFTEVKVTRVTAAEPAAPVQAESELDEATYNCGCGFVFQAPVLTSVDCPHCGDSQAW